MGYYPQESLYKPYKYHGYTVRGTPNCPLIQIGQISLSINVTFVATQRHRRFPGSQSKALLRLRFCRNGGARFFVYLASV